MNFNLTMTKELPTEDGQYLMLYYDAGCLQDVEEVWVEEGKVVTPLGRVQLLNELHYMHWIKLPEEEEVSSE